MSNNITKAFINQVNGNIISELQNKGGILMPTVTIKSDIYGETSKLVDIIGTADAAPLGARHSKTVAGSIDYDSRHLNPTTYVSTQWLAFNDDLRMLIRPQNSIKDAINMGMRRQFDDTIVAALGGVARTGKNGATNTALPASQKIAHGNTGLTVAKLLRTRTAFLNADVDLNMEKITIVVSPNQLENMLNYEKATNSDYVGAIYPLVSGEITKFLGMNFVSTTRLPLASGVRTCYAYVRSGITLGMWANTQVFVSRLPTQNQDIQIQMFATVGATRVMEKKVMQVFCHE